MGFWSSVGSALSSAASSVSSAVSSVGRGIVSATKAAWDTAKTAASKAIDWMADEAENALHIFLSSNAQTTCAWVDSTTLPVCKNQRIQRHQSLKQIATRGKSSMGWFYGCKLHVLVDAQGQLIQTQLSNGHTSNIKILPKLAQGYMGKIFGDRSYISEILKDKLGTQGVELMTYHRKNMRQVELSPEDEIMLRQRNKIETIFSLLKQQYNRISSRHRSISSYFAGIYASLCADQICHQNKPQFTMM